MITRAQLLSEVRQLLDAVTSQRWLDTSLARYAGLQMRRDWAEILKENRYYRWAERNPTLTDGTFDVSALTVGAQAAIEHFYRILTVRGQDGEEFVQSDGVDFAFGAGGTVQSQLRRWWREGDRIRITPQNHSGLLRVYVNHYPALVHELGDNDTVKYPDGYEMALAWGTAALAFSKGNAETDGTAEFQVLAREMRRDMLEDIGRDSIKPRAIEPVDSPLEWEA